MICCTECKYCEGEGYVYYCANKESPWYADIVCSEIFNYKICEHFKEVEDGKQ